MCVWTGYTLRSVPPRQLSPWEQYHLSLTATRQWRPDGEQRVEDRTKCRPKQGDQIKFFRYSWCQEPMVLLFITVCMGNTAVAICLSFSFLIFFSLGLCFFVSFALRYTYIHRHDGVIRWYCFENTLLWQHLWCKAIFVLMGAIVRVTYSTVGH